MSLSEILAPVQPDLRAVDQLIRDRLHSDVVLIRQLGEHIIASGGKRLRPALVLLSARALNAAEPGQIQLAAIIEFIHTATLLHDDVVDHSTLRRGTPTANALWGNEASVLTGDFLYSRSFELMVELAQMPVLEVLARTTNLIAEGEVLQLMHSHDPGITEATYDQVIDRKTAILFEAATRASALLAKATDNQVDALARYGRELGRAFQLIDDCLDYQSDSAKTGKELGDDLAEGKVTLPLIIAMQRCGSEDRERIAQAISAGGRDELQRIISVIDATGAITYTSRRAQTCAQSAKQAIGDLASSPAKTALLQLADFAVSRAY